MRKALFVALAALALMGYAMAQTTPSASPNTASPSVTQDKGATQPQSGTAQPSQQQNPISPEGAERSRNPQRGEDVGQQGEHVPVAGQRAAQGTDENNLPPNTPILAELTKNLEVKKVKEGDQVVARVVQDVLKEGNVLIPHGARLIGKVTLAKPVAKGNKQSELGIAWERAEMRSGEQVPLQADIQALAPRPQTSQNAPVTMGTPSAQSGGPYGAPQGNGPMGQPGGGAAGTMGAPGGPPSPGGAPGAPEPGGIGAQTGENPTTMPTSGQRAGGPVLNVRSSGVQGMPGVTLSPQPNRAQGSVLRDERGNLKLENGTQLVLRVVAP